MKNILILSLTILLFACADDRELTAKEAIKHLQNIEGEWQLQPASRSNEIWQKAPDGSIIGRGITITENNDTLTTELYFIEPVKDSLRLQVQPVKEGAMSMPISYMYATGTKNKFEFVNTSHNFPQKIIYNIDKKEYTVMLEGEIGGMHQQANLRYKKIK